MSRTLHKPSSIDPTFPDYLTPLASKFYQQALTHPAYLLLSPVAIRQSVENRLFAIVCKSPWWFGRLKMDRKREATEAQLAALEKARQAKIERNREDEAYAQQLAEARRADPDARAKATTAT